jgi:hypothetical protein
MHSSAAGTERKLFDYLPAILRETKELTILVDRAEQPESDRLWDRLDRLWAEQFIETAGDAALSRWEGMMGLPPAPSLEERRAAVLRRLREAPPFTLNDLIAWLDEMCGRGRVTIEINYSLYKLTVRLAPDGPLTAVESFLARRLPANILLDADFYYARHADLRPFRHMALAAKTHLRIREDI